MVNNGLRRARRPAARPPVLRAARHARRQALGGVEPRSDRAARRESADVARAIAEGALMRLRAGERCFEKYRAVLEVPA